MIQNRILAICKSIFPSNSYTARHKLTQSPAEPNRQCAKRGCQGESRGHSFGRNPTLPQGQVSIGTAPQRLRSQRQPSANVDTAYGLSAKESASKRRCSCGTRSERRRVAAAFGPRGLRARVQTMVWCSHPFHCQGQASTRWFLPGAPIRRMSSAASSRLLHRRVFEAGVTRTVHAGQRVPGGVNWNQVARNWNQALRATGVMSNCLVQPAAGIWLRQAAVGIENVGAAAGNDHSANDRPATKLSAIELSATW